MYSQWPRITRLQWTHCAKLGRCENRHIYEDAWDDREIATLAIIRQGMLELPLAWVYHVNGVWHSLQV